MLHITISVLTPRTATLPSADACGLPPFTPCCYAVKHPPVHSFALFLVQTALVGASLKHSGCKVVKEKHHTGLVVTSVSSRSRNSYRHVHICSPANPTEVTEQTATLR